MRLKESKEEVPRIHAISSHATRSFLGLVQTANGLHTRAVSDGKKADYFGTL